MNEEDFWKMQETHRPGIRKIIDELRSQYPDKDDHYLLALAKTEWHIRNNAGLI